MDFENRDKSLVQCDLCLAVYPVNFINYVWNDPCCPKCHQRPRWTVDINWPNPYQVAWYSWETSE